MNLDITELSDEQLLLEAKKAKKTKIYDTVIFGVLIGISGYSTVKNGLGLMLFIPLIYLFVAARNQARNKRLQEQLKERGLELD